MKIGIGSDEVGAELEASITAFLEVQNEVPVEVIAYRLSGPQVIDAPDVAVLVGMAVAQGEIDRGILVCGSGVGMTITANKVPGVRAAQCHDVYTAQHARNSNDAQILVMGSKVVNEALARDIVAVWLKADFESNPRRLAKMAKIDAIEKRFIVVNRDSESND